MHLSHLPDDGPLLTFPSNFGHLNFRSLVAAQSLFHPCLSNSPVKNDCPAHNYRCLLRKLRRLSSCKGGCQMWNRTQQAQDHPVSNMEDRMDTSTCREVGALPSWTALCRFC
jgi:hypothetical protein